MASAALAGRQDNPEEYLGLPGDNLNLYAVMKLFQESETLEAFEKGLNDQESRINNLDLNTDGYVDYLTVSDYVNGNVHTIVLRSVLDRNEYQDVAVFTVEQLRNGEVQIQLIGDEALYGKNYIVEPIYAETPNPGYNGRAVQRNNVTVVTTTYYEVAAWPVIRYMYNPYYSIWRSNWYWGYYPVYWHPWRPFFWHEYYGYHYHWYPTYYSCYRHWNQPRWHHYHDYYYTNVRAYSPNVSHRITEGNYRQTYSRPDTRKDGEALYNSTQGRRSAGSQPASVGSDRRSSAATGSRPAGSQPASTGSDRRSSAATGSRPAGSQPASAGSDRRSSAATGSRPAGNETGTVREGTGQAGQTRRAATTQSTVGSRQSAAGQSTERRTVSTEQRTPATVQRSSQAPSNRSQSTVQRSSQAPSNRTQSTVQRSSQTSRGSQQPAVSSRQSSGSRQSVSQRSSSTVSRSSSAPAARSQSSSGRSSANVSSRSSRSSSRSSGTPSRSSSSSSSSSGKSDNSSRSSRR